MGFITGLFIGATGGVIAMAFIQGASLNNREQEAYMEGYLAGQVEALKEGDE